MKQMRSAWYLVVAVCISSLATQGALRAADTAVTATTVPLSTSVASYISAINAAVNKSTFVDVYNACLPLSLAVPSSMTDIGAVVCANWYRVDAQSLATIRDALTNAATRLLMAYKVQCPAFANVYGVNATFTTTLLSVNDPARSTTDPEWVAFIDPNSSTYPNGASFYTVFKMLRQRRDFFKATLDATTLAASTSFTPADIQNVKGDLKWLAKPALPTGAPAADDVVALRVDVGGSRHYMQVVWTPDGLMMGATGTDPLDPTVQFKMGVDFDTFGLQLTTTEALYLDAPNVVGSAGWLPTKRQKATRLVFSGSSFTPSSAVSGKFNLSTVTGSGANGTAVQFLMRSLNFTTTTGYVAVDLTGDLSVRVLNPASTLRADGTFVSYGASDATPFTFIKITDLHRTLGTLRATGDNAARISGYSTLFDGALMSTLEDFLLVVAEAQAYLDGCRADMTAWKNFTDAKGTELMRALIQKMRQNMVAAPSGSAAAAPTSAYAQQNSVVSALEVSLNSGMSSSAAGVRFADGTSIKNMLLVITTANGTMLSVGDGGIVSAIPRDLIDPTAQFVAETDASGNVNFRSAVAGNACLQIGGVSTNVSGWLPQARLDISRGSCVRQAPGNPEKFVLSVQGSVLGSYSFKNVDSQGYVQVDSDNLVRSVEPSGTGASLAPNITGPTVFTLVPVDSFIKQLSALRLEAQDQLRANGYMALVSQILTDAHVNLLLQELNSFVTGVVKSRTRWASWLTAGLNKALLQWMPSGLKAYSDRALYSTIEGLLITGYVADTSTTDKTGLTAGDVIVLKVPGQENTYLQVQPDGTFKQVTGAQYFLDPLCQLTIAKNSIDSSIVELISPALNNFALRAPDIAVPSGSADSLLTDRLAAMSCAKFDAAADANADFDIVVSAAGGIIPAVAEGVSFAIKRHGKEGFLKIGADLLVRFFDTSTTASAQVLPPVGATGATKLSYAVVTSLQKKFVALRGLTDDAARVSGYRGLLSSIVTLGDLKFLLFELKYYIQQPRLNAVAYTSFKSAQVALGELLTQIGTLFTNSLGQLDTTVPRVSDLQKLLATQLVQNIPAAFSALPTVDRVTHLESMFPSVTNASQATEFLALFGLTMTDRNMFSDGILNRMKALYAAILLNNYTKVSTTTMPGSAQKELDFWGAQLSAQVQFADVLNQLNVLSTTMTNTPAGAVIDEASKTQFVAYATALINILPTSSEEDRTGAVATLESAAYTYLNDRRTTLLAVNNTIKTYVKPQNTPATYSAQLDALTLELKSLTATSTGGAMDQFIANAKKMVNNRVQALDVDITRLGGILDDALWHPLVLNQPAVAANTTRYDAQLNALVSLVKVPIPYLDLIQNLTDMLDKNPSFAETDVTYFMARANQLLAAQASQKDPAVIDAAIKILTRGSRYQVGAQRVGLDQIISQLSTYRTSLSGAKGKTFIQKLNDLKSLLGSLDSQAATRSLTDAETQSFFEGLNNLVESRLDGTASQIDNLVAWLSSSVVNTSRLVFSRSDGIKQIQKIISVLQTIPPIADRFASLQVLLKNNPQFADSQLKLDFIEKANDFTTPDSRQAAVTEKFDIRTNLTQLLTFAKANQFAGDTSTTTGGQVLDGIITKLSVPLNQVLSTSQGIVALKTSFTALDFATQAALLDRGVSEIVDSGSATTFLTLLGIAVANRISGKDVDVARLQKAIQAATRSPGFVGDAVKLQSLQTSSTTLSQPLVFSDYFNALNVIVSAFPSDISKITSDTKNLVVTYAQKLADNLVSSVDQNARNVADAMIKKLAFSQLDDRSSELLKVCDIIEVYVPSEQVGQKYTQAIAALAPQIDALTTTGLQTFMKSLTDLVTRRAEGSTSDYEALKQIIDKLTWNKLVQNEAGQPTLKALAALTSVLAQPIPAVDLVDLLTARLKNTSFTPDDVAYFQGKAQALVDGRASITDKSVIDQAIALLNQAGRYQMASRRSDLDAMIATLQTQQQSFAQQAYVAYADQIAQMQTRLTALDTKAQAQQLASDEAAAFLKDLETLVKGRAQGLAADIQTLAAWLQSIIPQSRLFFVTAGAKDKGSALLTLLAQPVAYVDQYNYLVSVLRDYPHFASTQMTMDFLARCTYLASDEGKKQAQSEGFDYKKLIDILTFAEQNQLENVKAQVDVIVAQLNAPISGSLPVALSFNDKLTPLESSIVGLKDSGSNLTSFVTSLEGLVASRLEANDGELARLSQLLQKAQWNGAIRQSLQSASFLQKIQACLDGLAKPVLFTDEATYLIGLSKQALSVPDQQDRFIAAVTKLISMKDQATDAAALDQVIAAIKVVAYNQLQKRSELPPLVSQLDAYRAQMSQQIDLSFAQEISDLSTRSNNVTAATVDKFLSDLKDTVKGRFEAAPDQMQALTTLVNSVAWLNVIRNDSTKGYAKTVADLIKEVARVPSIAERIQDLASMLAVTEPLNDVQQESFVQKVLQLLAVKSKATTTQLKTIIQTINVAMFNQVKGRAQELQDPLNAFTRYQQTVQLTGGLSFGDRVKNLQQALPSLTQQGLNDFRQQVSDLFDARVDATDDDLAQFKTLLQAAVWNNVVVGLKSSGNTSASDDFTNWYNNVDAPIDFTVWKQSLAQMLLADTLPEPIQQQFLFKVGKLVAAIPRVKSAQDLQDTQALLTQASYNQLSSHKAELDLAISKLKDGANSQAAGNQLSFAERTKALQVQLGKLSKASVQADVDAFVKSVGTLIEQRVDAINDDLKVLQSWLLSNDVQNNEAIYFHQGGDALNRLANTVMDPISYGLRVQNLTTIIQNNTTFTDVQKVLIQAKIQLLVDQRAQAVKESFDLGDVVKMLQFVVDRRLDANIDAALIVKIKNAIYVLQSGSVGALRPRYGAQVDTVKASLATLVAADIPKFVASVKALVDGRADGTADQVSALRDWLIGTDVQANKVLFFSPQKTELQKMATTLLTPPAYVDRYNNLRQLLQDYPVFDSTDITQEFMLKALTLVKERGRAAAEKLDLQYVRDLFTFAIQNRLTSDATATGTLQQYSDALSSPPDQAIATGSSIPFAQRIGELQTQFKSITAGNFKDFVSALSQVVDYRVDGTDAEIAALKSWLMSNDVQNNRIVFLQGGLTQLQPLIEKLDVAITFAQRVDNLRVMIQNTASFTTEDSNTFFAKVDKLIGERWRAASENYNIEDVVKLLQFVQVNQFSDKSMATQAGTITTKITSLRTAPDQQGPAVAYVTYPDRVTAMQNKFIQIGSMQKDLATMRQFVTDLNQLVVDRVDGADTDRANLVTFIRSRVLYHQLVYGVAEFEQAFQKAINGLMAPITYGELYANFKKLLTVGVYSNAHKSLFVSKLQALVDNRGDASKANVDLDQLGRDITFAKINKFSQEIMDDQHRTPPDRNPFVKQIEDLTAQLQVAPLATLTAAIAKVQADINNLSPENWAAAGPDQKGSLLSRLRVLVNNVDSATSQADREAIDILLVTARARVFKGDDASIALLNQYRETLATASGGSASAVGATSSGVTAP